MQAQFLIPLWLMLLLLVPPIILSAVLLVTRPRQRWDWLRRLLILVLLGAIAIRPVTPVDGEQTHRMNANVFFVVDRTGSMNAEDYHGTQPRLDGVRADMRRVMGMTKGARYSIIGFDSSATRQLPLTTDAGAAEAWIDTLTSEPTAYSKGSNVDRPLTTLMTGISDAKREDPGSTVLVYVLTDGENTDGKKSESFAAAAQFIDGGAVLGYGTSTGGPMKAQGGRTAGEYITEANGAKGISTIDEAQLRAIAQQLGVPYVHRTDPEAGLEETMQGIELRPVPTKRARSSRTFEDWYWIAAIPVALLLVWELGAMTFRLPRRVDRREIRQASGTGGAS